MNLTFEASKGRKKHQGLVKGFFFFYDYLWLNTRCCSVTSVKTCEGGIRCELLQHAKHPLHAFLNGEKLKKDWKWKIVA